MNNRNMESILVEAGLLSPEKLKELKEIAAASGKELEKLLLSEEAINYKQLLGVMAQKMGVDFIDLESVKVNKKAVRMLNAETVRRYSVFPFDLRDNLLFLAMQNPDDIFLTDEIKVFTQMEIKPFLADIRLIDRAIGYFYPGALEECAVVAEADTGMDTAHTAGEDRQRCMPADSPGLKARENFEMEDFLSTMLRRALIPDHVSDIRIDPVSREITVTLRMKY